MREKKFETVCETPCARRDRSDRCSESIGRWSAQLNRRKISAIDAVGGAPNCDEFGDEMHNLCGFSFRTRRHSGEDRATSVRTAIRVGTVRGHAIAWRADGRNPTQHSDARHLPSPVRVRHLSRTPVHRDVHLTR